MTAPLTSLALAALCFVATSPYAAPHRSPDEVLESNLPDAHKIVWQAVRACQGGTPGTDVPPTRYPLGYIGRRCHKSANSVSKALVRLRREGWVELLGYDGRNPVLRCHCPPVSAPVSHRVGACESSNDEAQRLPVIESAPVSHRVGACESSKSGPYKEESCLDPVIHPETTTSGGGEPDPDAEGVVVLDGVGGKNPDPDRVAMNAAFALLRRRGVERSVAVELAREHWRHVPAVVEDYTRRLTSGEARGVGWLVATVRAYVPPAIPTPAAQASRHAGELPEAERASQARAETHAAPPASAETLAAAHAEIEAAAEAGRRALAERQERIRAERQAARRPAPQPDEVR